MAGQYTEKLGKNLAQELNSKSKYYVYQAHGKKTGENNVYRSTPFFGDEYSTSSTLSFVDIVIVERDKVKLLCEIEESGAAPKKIIGDIVNILVSNKVHIHGKEYGYDRPQLILGLKVNEKGKSCQKANSIPQELKKLINEPQWSLFKIEIICNGNLTELVKEVESKIMDWVNKTSHNSG